MNDLSSSLLFDKYNIYLENAKKYEKDNNVVLAKRNYLLAAETLMKLAKQSSDTLKKTRYDKAKSLASKAEYLTVENKIKTSKNQDDKNIKKWESAEIPNINFSDVIGLEDVKRAIQIKMINPIKYPDKYKIYKKKMGGGLLLFGPPGTGKTMIAKAIANEVGAKFYVVKGSDIVSKWVGESEKNINALFETAKNDDLAIIFIDEMDSLLAARGLDVHNDKRVNEFLQQIDGFTSKNQNLLVLGATNRPWNIDSAALRSGRFSQKVYVPLPDEKARTFLFKKYLSDLPLDKDVSINEFVSLTENYSGADIEEVCDRAKEEPLLKAIKTDSVVKITKNDIINAIRSIKVSTNFDELKKFQEFDGIK